MAFTVRRIDYFYIMIEDTPEVGYEVLSQLSEQNVNLVAITAVPFGPARTQLTVFPDDTAMMRRVAQQSNIPLDGPHPALVVQGDDEVGGGDNACVIRSPKRPSGFVRRWKDAAWPTNGQSCRTLFSKNTLVFGTSTRCPPSAQRQIPIAPAEPLRYPIRDFVH